MFNDTTRRTGLLLLAGLLSVGFMARTHKTDAPHPLVEPTPVVQTSHTITHFIDSDGTFKPIPKFLRESMNWLAEAQFSNGGWGAGMHSAQHVQDPQKVQIDPATTAFAATALVRSGSTLRKGPYKQNIRLALNYLLELVEDAPRDGSRITTITGTQPQVKLGQNIDASMVSQFFSRILPTIKDKQLRKRVERALDTCLLSIQGTQSADGSWSGPGWAPVLQSAMANSALELAEAAGREVDQEALAKSRDYQRKNLDKDGNVRTEAAAGISLYSISSSQRAAAMDAAEADDRLREAKEKGLVPEEEEVSYESLIKSGVRKDEAKKFADAYAQNAAASKLLDDDRIFSGFGNNGGEEFLSYMMTSESLAVIGGENWERWYGKMSNKLAAIQNQNGSWSGHHCITSPVFSTAAVIMTLTADRDRDLLRNRKQG